MPNSSGSHRRFPVAEPRHPVDRVILAIPRAIYGPKLGHTLPDWADPAPAMTRCNVIGRQASDGGEATTDQKVGGPHLSLPRPLRLPRAGFGGGRIEGMLSMGQLPTPWAFRTADWPRMLVGLKSLPRSRSGSSAAFPPWSRRSGRPRRGTRRLPHRRANSPLTLARYRQSRCSER